MSSDERANPLSSLILQPRSSKPRSQGVTMMIDWGVPHNQQADWLTVTAPYVDMAKIAVGVGALLSSETLTMKLELYRAHDILPFLGGMFLEHAVLHDKTEDFLQAVVDAGFDCVEISDNSLDLDLDEKCELIQLALEKYRLRVLGEVGKREGPESKSDLAEDAARCLEAGAEFVFLEAADFFATEVNEAALERVVQNCGVEPLIFELPGPWIRDINPSDVHRIMRWLINRFGSDCNIADVPPDLVLTLEALRVRLGVNVGRSS
ncbi:MAG: phosphosulfolactate synthase [Planctomycetales bacterium]